ncbi:MAG: hypothetical protein WBB65_01405 [Anaerolineales bacterium]
MIAPKPEVISGVGDGVGSGVNVGVGTKVGKKTVGVGSGGAGTGVCVGAGLALRQDDRSSPQAVMQTAGNRNRFLPPHSLVLIWRILLPLNTV